jgi:hypothetical protein
LFERGAGGEVEVNGEGSEHEDYSIYDFRFAIYNPSHGHRSPIQQSSRLSVLVRGL